MAQAGTVWVDVRGDTSRFVNDVRGAARTMGRSFAASGFGAVKTVLGDVARTTAQVATGFAAIGTAAGASLVAVGTDYNTLEQTSRAALTTVLGTSEAADEMMGKLREFAASSPFPRQAFISATQQLLAFGYEADAIIPTLSAIQDAVAAAGGGGQEIAEIADILAKVTSSGKFTAETLNQLGYRGVDAAQLIGDSMGMSAGRIREAITEGTLDADKAIEHLVASMTERFGGAAENVKETWVGAVDRIKGAWRDIGSDLMQPFIAREGGGYAVVWANMVADSLRHLQREVIPALAGPLEQLSKWIATAALEAAAFVNSIDSAKVTSGFERISSVASTLRSDLKGMEGVAVGAGVALAGMAGRSVLGPLGFLVPAISPITGVVGGLVAGSKEGRDMLRGLGAQARDFASGPGRELMRSVSGLAEELSRGLISMLGDVGSALFEAGERAVPVLVDAFKRLGPSLGDALEAFGELAVSVLPALVDITASVLPTAIGALSTGLDLAAGAMGFLAENTELAIPLLAAIVAFRFRDTLTGWVTGFRDFGRNIADAAKAASTEFTSLRSSGETVRSSFRGAAGAAGSLGGAVGLLNPAVLGVTAAVSAGIGIYSAWSSAKADAERKTRALTDALLAEGDTLTATVAEVRNQLRDFHGDDITEVFNRAGLSVRDIAKDLRAFPGEVDEFRSFFHDIGEEWENLEWAAQRMGVSIPDSVQKIYDAWDEGLIDDHEARQLVDALVNADKATGDAADNIVGYFNDIKSAARDAGIDISEFESRFADASTFEERKAIVEELKEEYPELADAIGLVATSAEQADTSLSGLLGTLSQFTGQKLEAEDAARRYAASLDRMVESFAQTGGISDLSDEGQRANWDAVKSAMQDAAAQAEAMARIDLSGTFSRATLEGAADALRDLHEAGKLTAGELEHLLDLYGLTPEQIDTTVALHTAQAQTELNKLQAEFDAKKATMEEPIAAEIQALIDEGEWEKANTRLAELERDRTATINVRTIIEDGVMMGSRGRSTLMSVPGKATGGWVAPGMALVGEHGPELLRLHGSGSVTPTSGVSTELARVDKSVRGDQFGAAMLQELIALRAAVAGMQPGGNVTIHQTGGTAETSIVDLLDGLDRASQAGLLPGRFTRTKVGG